MERAGELPEKPHLRHGPHLEAALPLGQGLRQDGHSQAGFGCLGQSSGTGALQQGLGRQALLGKYPVYRAARFPQEQGQGRQLFYGGRGGKAPRGRRQDQVLLIEGLGPQPFRNPQAVYNAHIQLVLRQQALDFVGVGHQGPQPHLWVFLTEAPQNLGQARLAKADVCPHPQGQRPPLAQGFLRLLEPPQHVLSRGKQGLPGRGQVDAAVHALEKGHAIMAFQLFNSQAHSGLGGI